MQTKCLNREAFSIVTGTKSVEDKCSETRKRKKKDNNDDKMGVNKEKSAKTHFSVNAFIINRFPLPRRGSQLLDS